jgi:undecaprenyl diphosphate synthase
MELLVMTISKETPTLMQNNIRLMSIGQMEDLPSSCQRQLAEAKKKTEGNTGMVLNLALSYGGRKDIVQAVQELCRQVKAGEIESTDINEKLFKSQLSTHFLPDPELMIRTSGEFRISNFLLWELAYSEIYITPKFWPDFRRADLYEAIADYQKRERRFGKTSEQIQTGA